MSSSTASSSLVATPTAAAGRQHYEQGWRYQKGIGVAKDLRMAVSCYRKSAEEGDANGLYALAQCYEQGLGVDKKSLSDAFTFYSRSAEEGHPRAQRNLGKLYENGWGVNKNLTLASLWYQKSAEQGDSEGEYCFGRCFEQGWGVEKDVSQAFKWFKRSAVQNDPGGWVHLGRCYENGWGVEKSPLEAFKCYRTSAEAGNALGQRYLGRCYENGWGTEVNLTLAYEWYLKSAEQGNSSAQVNLGWCFTNGLGVEKNVKQAFMWYMRSAELKDAWGENNVGRCYEWGLGVEKNLDLAYKYYRASAEKANPWGQYNLGRCYEKGWGVARDPKEAYGWYRMSGEQGNPTAQHNLAWCYEHGWGVDKNLVQARAWYKKSAAQGFSKAAEAHQRLLAMTGGEAIVAERHEHERLEQQGRDVRGGARAPSLRAGGGGWEDEAEVLRSENQRMKRERAEDRRELDELRADYARLLEQDRERKKGYARILEQEEVRKEEHVVLLTQVDQREAEVLRERLVLEEDKRKFAADMFQAERAAEARKLEHDNLVKELRRRILELEEGSNTSSSSTTSASSVPLQSRSVSQPVPEGANSSRRRSSMSVSEMELDGMRRGRDYAKVVKRLQEKEDEADLLQGEVQRLKTGWEQDAAELHQLREKYAQLLQHDNERKAGFARVLEQEDIRQDEHRQKLLEIERREAEVVKELEKLEEGKKKLTVMLEEMESAAWAQKEKHMTMVEELQTRVFELEEETARRDAESEQNIQLQELWREEERKRDSKKMKDLDTLRAKEHAAVVQQLKEKEAEVALLSEALEKLQKRNGESGVNGKEQRMAPDGTPEKELMAVMAEVEGLRSEVAQLLEDKKKLHSEVESLRKEADRLRNAAGGAEPRLRTAVDKDSSQTSVDKTGKSTDALVEEQEEAGEGREERRDVVIAAAGSGKEVSGLADGVIDASSLKYGAGDKVGVDCFGEVFHGIWGDTRVTIKKLRHQESMTQRKLGAFKTDIKMLAGLAHPNIVKVLGACLTRPQLAIVTEHVSGGNLWDMLHMRDDPPAWSMGEKVRMIMGMASGMVYLHSRGIVHRDLNSMSLFPVDGSKGGIIKIADAGLSKTRNAMLLGASPQERHKYGIGSPFWSAPEVLDNEILDARGWEKADMYSFAVTCSELVTMEAPFGEDGEEWTLEQMKTLVKKGRRPSLGTDTPVFLKELLQAAWHQEPKKRPTFGDFLSRLCEGASASGFFNEQGMLESAPGAHSCVMCLEADAVAMLTPCWHACICNADFEELQKVSEPRCPVCRTAVEGALQRSYSEPEPEVPPPGPPSPPPPTDLFSIPPSDYLT